MAISPQNDSVLYTVLLQTHMHVRSFIDSDIMSKIIICQNIPVMQLKTFVSAFQCHEYLKSFFHTLLAVK